MHLSDAAARIIGLGRLRHVAWTGSTNDDLANQARRGQTFPAVLVADHQSAGRGRLTRRWIDQDPESAGGPDPSCLLVSFRLPCELDAAANEVTAVSAAALEACQQALGDSGDVVRTKWPNDLLVESPSVHGKLAGVLADVVASTPAVVVVGIGINLSPLPGVEGAVSLAEAGADVDRDRLLAAIIEALGRYRRDYAAARTAIRRSSATIGSRVRVERHGLNPIVGIAHDVDDRGCLIVYAGGLMHRIEAGDVIHLRNA